MPPHGLVELGPISLDGMESLADELLDKRRARGFVFDQNNVDPVQKVLLQIPTIPDGYSDLKPDTVPTRSRTAFRFEAGRDEGAPAGQG